MPGEQVEGTEPKRAEKGHPDPSLLRVPSESGMSRISRKGIPGAFQVLGLWLPQSVL